MTVAMRLWPITGGKGNTCWTSLQEVGFLFPILRTIPLTLRPNGSGFLVLPTVCEDTDLPICAYI